MIRTRVEMRSLLHLRPVSEFAGFRFPPEVIGLRSAGSAPRGTSFDPRLGRGDRRNADILYSLHRRPHRIRPDERVLGTAGSTTATRTRHPRSSSSLVSTLHARDHTGTTRDGLEAGQIEVIADRERAEAKAALGTDPLAEFHRHNARMRSSAVRIVSSRPAGCGRQGNAFVPGSGTSRMVRLPARRKVLVWVYQGGDGPVRDALRFPCRPGCWRWLPVPVGVRFRCHPRAAGLVGVAA